jgi:hypothetical protein
VILPEHSGNTDYNTGVNIWSRKRTNTDSNDKGCSFCHANRDKVGKLKWHSNWQGVGEGSCYIDRKNWGGKGRNLNDEEYGRNRIDLNWKDGSYQDFYSNRAYW